MTHRELAEMIFKNKSIMNGYEPNATDDELIDYYAMLIEDHCSKQKLSIASIGSKRLDEHHDKHLLENFVQWLAHNTEAQSWLDKSFTHSAIVKSFFAACDSEKGGEKGVRDGVANANTYDPKNDHLFSNGG